MRYTIPVPMGRPRTRDFDLPPRMARKGNALYYVGADRRWIPLGSDLARAKRKWADLEYAVEERTVADLVDRYIADKMERRAENTVRQYKSCARAIRKEWGSTPCGSLHTTMICNWRDGLASKITGNTAISLLRVAYAAGIEWGWAESNPAADAGFNLVDSRPRYMTDAEYVAIRAAAPAWLQTAMGMSYLTALRLCDILAMRWSQVGEKYITVLPRKTQKSGVSLAFEITPELRAVVEAAKRRPVVGLYVVATDKGRPIGSRRLQEAFAAVVKGLRFTDCQFRDIRAKSATDADAIGQDAQKLLHHTSRKMTERYLKLGEIRVTEPLRRKL